MAVDMKELIADAAKKLLFQKHIRKLTVKDIVEECHITRQAFYYHFEDIPDLLRWSLERQSQKILEECLALEDTEDALCYFFRVAVSARPYVEQGLHSNYGEELEQMLTQLITSFFERVMEQKHLFEHYSHGDRKLIMRYHTGAIMGILRKWTEEDTQNLEQIVHLVRRLVNGEIRSSYGGLDRMTGV